MTLTQHIDQIVGDIDKVLATTPVRVNVFADVTGHDELGAPIGGGGLVSCENKF